MYKYIGIPNCKNFICISFPNSEFINAFNNLYHYLIPDDISIFSKIKKPSPKFKWVITIKQGEKRDIRIDNNHVILSFHDSETGIFQTTMDLVVLASHFIGIHHIVENHIIPLHSSAITSDGKNATLFIADGGRGKTTTAVQFSKEKHHTLISLDKTNIKGNQIVGGSKFLWMKKESFIAKNYINNIELLADYIVPASDDNGLYILSLDTLKCKISNNYPYNINKIYFVEYHTHKLQITKISKDYAKLRLYQQLIYFFYMWPGITLGNNEPLSTFGHDELIKKIAMETVNELIKNADIFLAKGNLEELK